MAVVRWYIEILTADILFFRSPGVFHSQDSFPSKFRPRSWETFSGVAAVGVFAAETHRELSARVGKPGKCHRKFYSSQKIECL